MAFYLKLLFIVIISLQECFGITGIQTVKEFSENNGRTVMDATLAPYLLMDVINSTSHKYPRPRDVIDATIYKIRNSNIFPEKVFFFLTRIGFGELRRCELGDQNFISHNFCNRMFYIDKIHFLMTKEVDWHERLQQKYDAISAYAHWGRNISWPETTLEDLDKPLYGGIAMSLLLSVVYIAELEKPTAFFYSLWRKIRPEIPFESVQTLRLWNEDIFHAKMDIIFILDGSCKDLDVPPNLNQKCHDLVPSLMSLIDLSADDSRVGMIVYKETPKILFPLTNISTPCYTRRSQMDSRPILKLRLKIYEYFKSLKNQTVSKINSLSQGIQTASNMLNINRVPHRFARLIIFLIVKDDSEHNESDYNESFNAVTEARASGINIITVITDEANSRNNATEYFLRNIMKNDTYHLTTLNQRYPFAMFDLVTDLSQVATQVLESDVKIGFNTSGRLTFHEIHYFNYHIGNYKENLLVNINAITTGSVLDNSKIKLGNSLLIGHYSYEFQKPSSAMFHGVIVVNTTTNEFKIPLTNSSSFVYLSINAVDLNEDEILVYNLGITFVDNDKENDSSNNISVLIITICIVLLLAGSVGIVFILKRFLQAKKSRIERVLMSNDFVSNAEDDFSEFQQL